MDDLEALGYTIMSLIDPEKVTWRGVPTKEIMINIKKEIISGKLVYNNNVPQKSNFNFSVI